MKKTIKYFVAFILTTIISIPLTLLLYKFEDWILIGSKLGLGIGGDIAILVMMMAALVGACNND